MSVISPETTVMVLSVRCRIDSDYQRYNKAGIVRVKGVVLILILGFTLVAQQAAIEGTVVDQSSGKPLPRVQVHLIPDGPPDSIGETYGALSDSAGHFSVASLKAGRYNVLLERAGYVGVPAKGSFRSPSVTIKAGQPLTDVRLEMARSSMISGKVLDEFGDPISGVAVNMVPVPPNIVGGLGQASDDRGEFRMLAAPGKYYIKASPQQMRGNNMPVEVRSDGSSETVYSPTFYPRAAGKDRASVVEVVAGRDAADLDIHLIPAASKRSLTITGHVTNLAEGATAFLLLVPSEGFEQGGPSMAPIGADGKFSFRGIQPGGYTALVQTYISKPELRAEAHLKLEDSDVLDLQLPLRPAGELVGTLEAPGRSQGTGKLTVHLVNAEQRFSFGSGNDQASGEVERDGTFRITNVWPGKFHALVEPLPDTAYLKSVEVDGSAVADGVIEIGAGGRSPKLKILLGLDGATISGKVTDNDGDAMTGVVSVYLLPDHKKVHEARGMEPGGKFRFTGIRPGKYRLAALGVERFYGNFENAEERNAAIQSLMEAGEEIEVLPGAKVVKDLKITEMGTTNGKKQ